MSVKTLFVYFRSKEDLAFADTSLRDALVAAVGSTSTTPARAVGDVLASALAHDADIEGYHRRVGDSEALRSRLLRMWAEYEDALTLALAARAGRHPAPADRLAAIQLVGIVRSFTSPEVRALDADGGSLASWLDDAVARVEAAPA